MMTSNGQQLSWNKARSYVVKVNPSLVKIIDQLDPDEKALPLRMARFRYGEEIASFSNSAPFLLLDKTCEGFFEFQDKPKTYGLVKAGEMGLTGHLLNLPTPLFQSLNWKITAGARSVFMLPKISDAEFHRKIEKAYNITVRKPDEPHMQWHVFKTIAATHSDWTCRVLFFDEAWQKHLNDPAWAQFHHFLLQQHHRHQPYNEQMTLIKMAMGLVQKERKIRFPLAHTEDMLYLFNLGLGMVPGFRFAHHEDALPLHLIQKTYLEYYGLKEYAPLILIPDYLDWQNKKELPLYASFNDSSSYYLSPRDNQTLSNAKKLHLLAGSFKKLHDFILGHSFIPETSTLHQFLRAWEIVFCHKNIEGYPRFSSLDSIPARDQGSMRAWQNTHYQFPIHSSFFQGSVAIHSSKRGE